MTYSLNGKLMSTMFTDGTAEILLDNILRIMSTETFSKNTSASIVGGEKKLLRLIEEGKIDSDKPTNTQNGKWHCNAAQVLQHCRCAKKIKKSNKKNRK